MENRVKLIIFGLVGILAVSIFVAYQNYSVKEELQRDKDKINQENSLLNNKVSKLDGALREKDNDIRQLNTELEKTARSNRELETAYEAAKKAQEELSKQLKEQQQRAPAVSTVSTLGMTSYSSQSDDEYWAQVVKENKDLGFQIGKLRTDLKSTQINNEQLQREKNSLELDLSNLKQGNEDLKRQLEYNQKVSDSIAQELVREKNDKIHIQESLQSIKSENVALARQLKSLNSRKVELEKNIQELQEDRGGLDQRMNDMESRLSERISKISELKDQLEGLRVQRGNIGMQQKDSVELPPIVVKAQSTDTDTAISSPGTVVISKKSPLVSKVVAINRENNFVIIDLGENSGIKVGDLFGVYKDSAKIATVQTIQTRKNISACDIKRENKPISVGDIVK